MTMNNKQQVWERRRRLPIKLSFSALILVLGPSDAWGEAGAIGLLIYLAVYIFSKAITAELASTSKNWVMNSYRFSPLLLFLGGIFPILIKLGDSNFGILNEFIIFTTIVPILFGAYEGAYWVGYHDFRNQLKEHNQSDEKSIDLFHQMEVICTVAGALIAAWLKSLETAPDFFAGTIAASLALVAFFIPWNKAVMIPGENFGSKSTLHSIKNGKKISQPFAVVQFVVQNAMRFAALQIGVLYLGLLVALAETSGYVISRVSTSWHDLHKRVSELETNISELTGQSRDLDSSVSTRSMNDKLWTYGYLASGIGIFVMILGNNIGMPVFVVGWFIAQSSIRGIMRPIEISLASEHLKDEKGRKSYGIRERLKFRGHVKFAMFFTPLLIFSEVNNLLKPDYIIIAWLSLGMVICAKIYTDISNNPSVYFAKNRS